MKRIVFTMAMLLGLCSISSAQKYLEKAKIKTQIDSVSYGVGLMMAQNLAEQGIKDLNPEMVAKAFYDINKNNTLALDMDMATTAAQEYYLSVQREIMEKTLAQEKEFFEKNAQEPGVKQTESGLQYLVIKEGSGRKPDQNSTVKIHYEGKLANGDVFDSSYDGDEPMETEIAYLIPGMAEGLMLMSEGSEYILYIPSSLGYGSYSPDESIPEYSILVFNVELISVSDTPAEEAVEEIEVHE